ncbi:hypothetical protein B5M09_003680 [Aphanomyces astaci]|uniref:ABC transporter domain-containing protein n=1 Tax=Aphanomyces astaci TaxID=112090 RepID=A0A3R7Y359_APHAT|nr:hypothetical protein B5M09_003680 [Aphanomyces astaci]
MLVRASVILFVVLLLCQLDPCAGDNTSNASNATYYIQYDHGIEVATYDGGSTSHRFRRRLDVIQSANQTLTNANSIVQAVIGMGESLKKNIDTVLADLNAIQTQGLTLDSGNNTLHDAQAVIQNGLLLTTQVQSLFLASQPATTAIPIQNDPTNVLSDVLTTKRTLDSLVGDITSIGTSGLTVAAAAKVIANLQVAVQTGLVVAKDGIDIINAVQNVISTGVSIAEGQVIASAIQLVLQKGLANFDLQPKVCRRQASFRGAPSPLVNQCLASEDPLGPLCLPKCRTGYEPAGFDSCRKVGCAGGTSDLGPWCSKPPSYERNGYALWDQAKCNKEKGTGRQGASVSLGLPKGECFGYLGINSAGNTTTMKMLTGDLVASSGSATLGGFDILAQQLDVRRLIGYCLQINALIDLLSVREHLELYAAIKSISAINDTVATLMTQMNLDD